MIILRKLFSNISIQWKYASPVDIENIEEVEDVLDIEIPDQLIEIILVGNNGSPSKNRFVVGNNETIFKTLLSYNEKDKENVYKAFKVVPKGLIPFGNTPTGDFICLENINNGINPRREDKVVLWDHETGEIIPVTSSLTEFLRKLH